MSASGISRSNQTNGHPKSEHSELLRKLKKTEAFRETGLDPQARLYCAPTENTLRVTTDSPEATTRTWRTIQSKDVATIHQALKKLSESSSTTSKVRKLEETVKDLNKTNAELTARLEETEAANTKLREQLPGKISGWCSWTTKAAIGAVALYSISMLGMQMYFHRYVADSQEPLICATDAADPYCQDWHNVPPQPLMETVALAMHDLYSRLFVIQPSNHIG